MTYDGLLDNLGQSQVLPYIRACSSSELDFTILSFEKSEADSHAIQKLEQTLLTEGIKWVYCSYHKKPPLLSTFRDLFNMIRKARKIILTEGIHVLHCRSYVTAFAGFYLKDRIPLKVIFDMRGFWADERLEGGIWRRSNMLHSVIYNYLKKKEIYWFEQSDQLVSLTQKGKEILLQLSPKLKADSITVIPCCADQDLFQIGTENDRDALRKKLGVGLRERTLIYVGSLGTWYLAEEMMRFFATYKERGVFHRFIWLTREAEDTIQDLARAEGLSEESIIVRSANRREVPTYISAADMGIFFIRPSFSKSASSPTKLGEMLLCGLPVIANKGVGDLDSFFEQHKVGLCVGLDESQQIEVREIENLLNIPPEKIREVGQKELSLSLATNRYRSVYKNLK